MKCTLTVMLLVATYFSWSQMQLRPTLGFSAGLMNYEGDLKPKSFTYRSSSPFMMLSLRVPVHPRITWRSGLLHGHLQASDRDNRDYLRLRNLSFHTPLTELNTGIEIPFSSFDRTRLVPHLYGGVALFRFNPWTYDENGKKVFLQPLGTEGQGLTGFPERKPYRLTQLALVWAGGLRYLVSDNLRLGIEFSQRKTFTDYLDDVSSSYADYNLMLQEKGPTAVNLAFRSDELDNSLAYPQHGEQRGTPTEKDWYYYLGFSLELDLGLIRNKILEVIYGEKNWYYRKCPDRF